MRAVTRSLLFAAVVGGTLSTASTARAQSAGNVDINPFRFAMDSRGYLTLNSAQTLGHTDLSLGIVTNWGRDLLRFESGGDTFVVSNVISPTIHGALGLDLAGLALELGVALPFVIMNADRGPDDLGDPANPNDDQRYDLAGQGLGNIGVHVKARLVNPARKHRFGVSVVLGANLPTVSEKDRFLGDDGLTPQASLVLERVFDKDRRLRATLNAGARFRLGETSYTDQGAFNPDGTLEPGSPVTNATVDAGSLELPVGLGVSYALSLQKVDLVAEVAGAIPLGGEGYFPLEALAGVKLYLGRNSFLALGGGYGLMPAEGASPDGRAFIAIILEPRVGDRDGDGYTDDIDACPSDPEDFDDFQDEEGCPEDNDGDGIKDVDDSCIMIPEDKDGDADEDGCPEDADGDRDKDGFKDEDDQCPDDPEDFDEFEDTEGCPEPDNDQDGILDVDDICINDPEDFDKWQDVDGCPEEDNDRDRIVDGADRCPNPESEDDPLELSQETYNGKDDDDGCPDKGRVVVTDTNIQILDKIFFELDKAVIKPESFEILDAVAATLLGNPDILLLEIQGHTDSRGNDAYNLDLSDRRAAAVRQYLVDKGVEDTRLTSQGYGETQPLVRQENEAAWAKNRRVEFLILKRGES
jgi:outer membrane protein OmpA-like peptidoglycan-associated protein